MKKFSAILRKDRIEYIRSMKGVICVATIFLCCAMVLGATLALPGLLGRLTEKGGILSESTSASDFMGRFFPENLRQSMGVLSSDIAVFYGIVTIILCYRIVPDEVLSKRVILPMCAGYSKKELLISKKIIYSILMSVPVYAFYMLYYLLASNYLMKNYRIDQACVNGILLAFCIFVIVNITMSLSMVVRSRLGILVTMIGVIIAVPDVLTFFSFGKYLPTYLLTLTYLSNTDYELIIAPIVTTIVLLICIEVFVFFRTDKINLRE